jgi:hypothetical protein
MAAVLLAFHVASPTAGAEARVLGAGVETGSWATPGEREWLRKLGAWDTRLLRGLEFAAHLETARPMARKLMARDEQTVVLHSKALEPAGSCSRNLARNVGPPTTARLRAAYEIFLSACAHLQRFHAAITNAIDQRETSATGAAQNEAQRAATLLSRADQMLPPGEVRTLPVIAGASRQSRVEPGFGRIASELAGKQLDVRCWSDVDWRHLMREESSYTQGKLGSGTLAFAGIGGSRVNLGPTVCAGLVDLAYKRFRPTDEGGRLLLASAVVTLSHEPQHAKGIAEEFVAECNAIQLANETAMKLGAGRAYAAALVRTYWRHYAEELPAYRTPECRRGGRLDLGRSTSIWP